MSNYDKIAALESEFKGRQWSEIPQERINEIDWFGYGWPTIDRYGDYIGACLGAAEMGDTSARTTIVIDPNGTDWMLLDYPDSDDEPVLLPGGFRVSPEND